ncbi:MAG: class I SAM-dependent methyltransferase [Gammaproteobacteria bacterium]|nr:class I SAM-dependent methyltransferase [Gammaproteobacteria bacterium]
MRTFLLVLPGIVGPVPATAVDGERVAPFVVSPERDVERMLDLAEVGPQDYLVDLGSGDGRIVIAAGRRGALAHGVEIETELVEQARKRARAVGVDDRVAFVEGDLFEADFRHASVVMLYLFPEANLRLRPRLLRTLEPGTRVVSNSFDMGDWKPDAHIESATSGGIRMWIIPARVEGEWTLRIGSERRRMELLQVYQHLAGEIATGSDPARLRSPVLHGARIRFEAVLDGVPHRFSGRVEDGLMTGTVHRDQGDRTRVDAWTAVRNTNDDAR